LPPRRRSTPSTRRRLATWRVTSRFALSLKPNVAYLGISAIFASTSLSPSVLPARESRRAAVFTSWARSLIAARSSSVNPLDASPVMLLTDCCVPVFAGFLSAIAKHVRAPNESQPLGGRVNGDVHGGHGRCGSVTGFSFPDRLRDLLDRRDRATSRLSALHPFAYISVDHGARVSAGYGHFDGARSTCRPR
jgi:hypothetical protein